MKIRRIIGVCRKGYYPLQVIIAITSILCKRGGKFSLFYLFSASAVFDSLGLLQVN